MGEITWRKIVPYALRYLVKGQDIETGEWVIGFPYVLVKEYEDGTVGTIDCIFEFSTEGEDASIPDPYVVAIPRKEFHAVKCMFRFVYIDDKSIAHFEDEVSNPVKS